LTAEEASLALDAEMQRAHAKPVAAAAEPEGSMPEGSMYDQPTSSHTVVAQAQEAGTVSGVSAFAAAASAGGATDLSCQHSAFGVQPAQTPAPAEAFTLRLPLQNPSLSHAPFRSHIGMEELAAHP